MYDYSNLRLKYSFLYFKDKIYSSKSQAKFVYNKMSINFKERIVELHSKLFKTTNEEVKHFINNTKIWESVIFTQISGNLNEDTSNNLALLIFLSILQESPIKVSRIFKNLGIILHVFSNFSSHYDFYYNLVLSSLQKLRTEKFKDTFYKFGILKALSCPKQEIISELEQKIVNKVKIWSKKVYLGVDGIKLVKYLCYLVELVKLDDNFKGYFEENVIQTLKILEKACTSDRIDSSLPYEYQNFLNLTIIHSLNQIELEYNQKTLVDSVITTFFSTIGKNSEYECVSHKLQFPFFPKDPWACLQINPDELVSTGNYRIDDLKGIKVYHHTALYQDYLELNVKVIEVVNGDCMPSLGIIFKQLAARSKLAGNKNCLQKLVDIFEANDRFYLIFEPFHTTLIELLSNFIKSKNSLPEKYLKKITKKLLITFAKLEKNKFFHGNLKPHHILCNKNWDLRICNFQDTKLDFDLAFKHPNELLTDLKSYSAPDFPKNIDSKFGLDKKKVDIFSLGMVLLQLASLKKLNGLNTDEHRRLQEIENIKYPWLKELLMSMLKPNFSERPYFREALDLFKRNSKDQ